MNGHTLLETVEHDYKHTQKLILEIRNQLELLETERDTSSTLQEKVSMNMNKLARFEHTLRQNVAQLTQNQKKDLWLRQTEQVTDELYFLRKSVDRYLKKVNSYRRDRELLLQLEQQGTGRRRRHISEDPNENLEELEVQRESLSQSERVIEQIKDVGQSVLEMLGGQRDTLKKARSSLLDLGVMLGVSRSTLNYIDRRLQLDKLIVYCGMFVVSLLLVFVFYWRFWSK